MTPADAQDILGAFGICVIIVILVFGFPAILIYLTDKFPKTMKNIAYVLGGVSAVIMFCGFIFLILRALAIV